MPQALEITFDKYILDTRLLKASNGKDKNNHIRETVYKKNNNCLMEFIKKEFLENVPRFIDI